MFRIGQLFTFFWSISALNASDAATEPLVVISGYTLQIYSQNISQTYFYTVLSLYSLIFIPLTLLTVSIQESNI